MRDGCDDLPFDNAARRGGEMVMVVRWVAAAAVVAATVTVALGGLAQAAAAGSAPAASVAAGAAPAALPGAPVPPMAFVRAGSVYLLTGTRVTRLTRDADDARPRFSPDGTLIAFTHAGRLWVMNADGTGRRAVASGVAGGAGWSPDGTRLAFEAPGCTGLAGVFTVSVTGGAAQPLFPLECRDEPVPAAAAPARPSGDLATRLRVDGSVAWSPDGTRIAFPGGQCLEIVDDCLTVGTVASGDEQMVAGYGGGGQVRSGFAVLPAWRPDGVRLAWTAEQDGTPVHLVEADPTGMSARTVGLPGDREITYTGPGYGLVTGEYQGGSWIFEVDLATGARARLVQGSQPNASGVGGAG